MNLRSYEIIFERDR
jgi:hypothetical protein